MKKLFKYSTLTGAALVLLSGVLLIAVRFYARRETEARIRITSPNGIHAIERIQLGGVEQWIQVRGEDRTRPILLFLHGGPGFPQMPFAHLNAELEKHFVVVQWDQRGAGKSYSWSIRDDSMRVEQFVSDTHDLVQMLLQRFQQPKCYLVAHSWGTVFGTLVVARDPQLFCAYVSIGQVADFPESQQVRYQFALDGARRDQNEKALATLRRIGRPPYPNYDQSDLLEKWVSHYADRTYPNISPWRNLRSKASPTSLLQSIPISPRYT